MESSNFKKIPLCFSHVNEDYLVVPKLKQFCNEKGIKKDDGLNLIEKYELIKSLEKYYNKDEKTKSEVAVFLDECLKEGIKRIIVGEIEGCRELKKVKNLDEFLIDSFSVYNKTNTNVILAHNDENINLCGFNFEKDKESNLKKIELKFTVLLREQKSRKSNFNTIIYPIFVTIDVENGYIIGRAKSKSGLYRKVFLGENENYIDEFGNDLTVGKSTDCIKLVEETFNLITSKINFIKILKGFDTVDNFKRRIHKLIDQCTKTPEEIEKKLENEEKIINLFVKDFFSRHNIDFFENSNFEIASDDIRIFMEKYLSINEINKDIFTKDRYGYPIKIGATDSELSSVEEVSSDETPLQCTSIFFDNKKILNREQRCDYVKFIFNRSKFKYFTNEKFIVNIEIKRGFLHLDFKQYTLEEDIENVLSRIIRNN
ncbi:TPA: hypothetical protein I9Z31_001136 [Clostridium perfringens]|nr:hypothetical protein [Clostridium perfringens]